MLDMTVEMNGDSRMIKYLVTFMLFLILNASCGSGWPLLVFNVPLGGRAEDGQQGPPGDAGEDGDHCWDLNGNGECDEGEDWRGSDSGSDGEIVGPDGFCDIWDCRGATGAAGPVGATGDRGPQGDQGDTGANGERGDTGPQGPPGANGEDGVDGQDGSGPCPNGNPHGPCDG